MLLVVLLLVIRLPLHAPLLLSSPSHKLAAEAQKRVRTGNLTRSQGVIGNIAEKRRRERAWNNFAVVTRRRRRRIHTVGYHRAL